ncbi:related to PPN1 - vacuolar endopolyphosphatase [Ustilago sp. UG-2017b]|nr:related to PPN1 - vacuolar endopolyphosphatase [Ustilago sp. UG-2017b]
MRSIAAATAALLLTQAALLPSTAASLPQAAFSAESAPSSSTNNSSSRTHPITTLRKPFGRFLHVTDLHPDPHYKYNSAVNAACHHKKPKKHKSEGKQRAGWWGTALSDCDSPPHLVESSLKWAASNLVSSSEGLDFIIWTGDSARHDNDNKLPRSNKEIFELNRWTLSQLETAFPGVPLIPTVGNNDIFPHNILFPGPNAVTKEYVQIWRDHIPEYEFHTFEQGGYYVKEILPNRLAAMSLNTLYFYDNNKAVDGCVKRKGKKADPGTAQLDWLEVQLDLFRRRGMQVHLLGHVPPTAGNYFGKCYRRYTDIVLRFQDTVVGQHFGHMNTDAFFVQEDMEAVYSSISSEAGMGDEAEAEVEPEEMEEEMEEMEEAEERDEVETKDEGLPGDLKRDFSTLPGKGRTNKDFYSVFFVAPSIIPTYYPSIRLWTYNVSESARNQPFTSNLNTISSIEPNTGLGEDDDEELEPFSRHHHRPTPPKKKKGKKHRKHKLPRHTSPSSPSRTNTYLSMLGYSQWVMDIDDQNETIESILHPHKLNSAGVGEEKKKHRDKDDEEKKKRRKEAGKQQVSYKLEYATHPPEVLWQEFDPSFTQRGLRGPVPVPKALLEKELKRAGLKQPFITSEVDEEKKGTGRRKLAKPLRKLTDYSLPSVTVGEMMDLARRLVVDKKLWKQFVARIYSESGYKP